jgi:transposase
MIVQNHPSKSLSHKRFQLNAHPVIQQFIDQLHVGNIINACIKQDLRASLGIEKTIIVLIHNILTSPAPLYQISDWARPIDEEKMGLDLNDSSLLNDDRIGKALSSFYNGNHKEVFFRLALRAIKLFVLDCGQIHQDTTTVTFHGKYEGWNRFPMIMQGHNKDHRPDLKQLVLGLSVTADGSIPLVHEIYDGNQTDDQLHVSNFRRLRKLLGRSDFTYIADCKLSTESNLRVIASYGGFFITVMPKTWKESLSFFEKVRSRKIKWGFLMSKPDNRHPDSKNDFFYLAKGSYSSSQGYRLIWVKSSQKKEFDSETRRQKIEKTMDSLRKIQSQLNSYNLKTRGNIEKKTSSVLQENGCSGFITCGIDEKKYNKKVFEKRGRPHSQDAGQIISETYYTLSFQLDNDAIEKEALCDGIFPLLTNHRKLLPKKILEKYKYQPFLEKRHSQLKTYQEIAPVYLKRPERIVAYLHVHVMALMVATLIERKLRQAMASNKIKALKIYPEKKPCRYPTLFDIARLFHNVEKYEIQDKSNGYVFPPKLTALQKQVLNLLGVPLYSYQ